MIVSGLHLQNHDVVKLGRLEDRVEMLLSDDTNVEVTLVDLNGTKISFPASRNSTIIDLEVSLCRRTDIDRDLVGRGLQYSRTRLGFSVVEDSDTKLDELGITGNSIIVHPSCILDNNIKLEIRPLCGGQSSRTVEIPPASILRDIMEDICQRQGKQLPEVRLSFKSEEVSEAWSPVDLGMMDNVSTLDFCSDASGQSCQCQETMFYDAKSA